MTSSSPTIGVRADLERSRRLLREKLLALMPEEGSHPTPIRSFSIHRFDSDGTPKPVMYRPVVIVVAQGRKWTRIGGEETVYGDHQSFIAGVDMPVASCIRDVSAEKPFLSLALELDPGLFMQLAADVPPVRSLTPFSSCGARVHDTDAPLLDAFLRLTELIEKPEERPVLEPLLLREIHYRLLSGPFGPQLRTLHTYGSRSNQIVRAIAWLREHFREPLQVDCLAELVNMATSTLHKHFKEVTTLSPLQYQKRLRLTEAQRLMWAGGLDATQAAFAVGYESLSQFNREYKRLFGQPPGRDARKLRHPDAPLPPLPSRTAERTVPPSFAEEAVL